MKIKRQYSKILQPTERVRNSQPPPTTRQTRHAARGCGGFAPDNGGRLGRVQGTPAQTRTSCGFAGRGRVACVGAKVRRVGAGLWGFGTIVGVIPRGVNPRWYCRRHNLPLVFGVRSESANYERYVVACDDGRYHTPNKVEVV